VGSATEAVGRSPSIARSLSSSESTTLATPCTPTSKSVFAKTVRSRSELVGQIFLEHYVPRWEDIPAIPTGWIAMASPIPAGVDPGPSPAVMLA